MTTENRDFSALLNTKCERKMKRKAAKQLKSTWKKGQSHQQINVDSIVAKQLEDTKRKKKLEKRRRLRNKKRKEKIELERKKRIEGKNEENFDETDEEEGEDENCTIEQFREEAEKVRSERLKEDLDEDDREIRRLERLLKKSKRRKKGKTEVEMSEDELEKIFLGNASGGEED
ncbi:unnamed protein product [Meloidogyne enterolobii]|uniref:Uncharacterized protein n=1 Tax=Meloidogyne enterolobii TaxID=390850 RepID=A0ACB0YK37_MELEN